MEDRTVPAIFGFPWADARNLTLSFVPDGTPVDGVGSSLFRSLPGPAPAWQAEVLRAVQTWAANANINVAVVPDGGQALGTAGPAQGDPRFGDLRIAARPLSDNVLAITTPSGVVGGTRTGDIVLNSTKPFTAGGGGGYDLDAVLLQEVGHAFGVANSADPASPMYEQYAGARAGLTAADVATIQALYGARAPDSLEGPNGNDTPATAWALQLPSGHHDDDTLVARADLTAARDVDYYRITTPHSNNWHDGLTVQVNTGLSLLAAKVTVLDAAGQVLGQASSAAPQPGAPLRVHFDTATRDTGYYLKVEAANPQFGVGAYQVRVVFNSSAPDVVVEGSARPYDDPHKDDTLATALALPTAAGYAANTHYSLLATLRDAADVDDYQIHAPAAGANQQAVLTVNVRALNPLALDALARVYDARGQSVNAQVLVNDNGSYTVQVAGAAPGADYVILVRADAPGGSGDYQLDVDFRSVAVNLQDFAAGSLTAAQPKSYVTLQANRSQMMHFVLAVPGVAGAVQAGVRMVVYDTRGTVSAVLFAQAGQTVSADSYLAAGLYGVRFEGLTRTGAALPGLTYTLRGVTLTDPIGPLPAEPSTTPPDYNWARNQDAYYALLVLLDPLSGVAW